MPSIDTIRRISVQYRSEGADAVRSDANAVAAAQTNMAAATERASTVTERAAKRQLSAAAEFERAMQRIDRAAKAQAQIERELRAFDRAASQGVAGASDRGAFAAQATARYMPRSGPANDDHFEVARRGLDAHDRSFIQYSAFSGLSSLTAGASLGTVAAQQGTGIVQLLADREGGLKAGLADVGSSVSKLLTPLALGGTAVTALGAAFAAAALSASKEQEALQKATQGIGAATGATVGQLDAIARASTEAGKVTTSAAREIVSGYAQTGSIALPALEELTRATSEYARLTSQDVPAAVSELGRMFSDPAKGADDLAAKIGGLDDRTRQLIQTQQEQGDRSAAQETLAAALKVQIDLNTQATTGWAGAWNTLAGAADKAWESLKRAAGAATGLAPLSAQAALEKAQGQLDAANANRKAFGMQPLGLGDRLVAERDAASVEADRVRREAEGRAAEERADKASRAAGDVARSYDPQVARLSELKDQQSKLRDALADPLSRSKLNDVGQVEDAYTAATRAISTMTDATGRLISQQELSRRSDQLRLDSLNATTDAQKKAVAEQQKALELAGKTITPGDARGQIERAGQIALASIPEKKGGGRAKGEADDEFDRALKTAENQLRRQEEANATFGMGAAAVARYKTETELLTAAKRAERDITPALSAQVQDYAAKAAAAADAQEKLREQMRDMDSVRGGAKDIFGGFASDLAHGTSAAHTFANALGKIESKLLDLATSSITDSLFGKTGSNDRGLLGGLLGGAAGSSGGAGLGSIFGWLTGSKSFIGFAGGGYTGDGSKYQPAGIVHAGEYVMPAHTVRQYGRSFFDGISGLRGYADGGFVAMPQISGPVPPVPAANVNAPAPTGPGDTWNLDLRGSSLTEGQVRGAIVQAIQTNNSARDRTFNERQAMARRRFG